ncbi:hypothetical protein [Nitrosomonas ureae]|uniref:Uncharacterized protein n=1 Tax=Nitrosomonas ureae TaxID=44577 RepID=A0A1H2H4F2_9PROT|nr:hypothetical protein [Nitrosomonas ureae]ALQ51679.1 hypothetical protein ATY38_10885 [Nitrosomonas ureae]SDU26609.1 hypothetical protein SAMN05216406_1414 [Nitrosomonas ureae]
MQRKIQILEKETHNCIAQYLINLRDSSTKQDYFAKAWANAVSEGLVETTNETDYEMKFVFR